jgi:hypothetical protein
LFLPPPVVVPKAGKEVLTESSLQVVAAMEVFGADRGDRLDPDREYFAQAVLDHGVDLHGSWVS